MLKVYTYVEYPDRIRRVILDEDGKKAKLGLLQRGVRFKNFGLEPIKTFHLLIGKNLFADKEYIFVLRTVRRYLENNRSVLEALKTVSFSPDTNISLLGSILYDRVLAGRSFAEACKGIFPDHIVSLLKVAGRDSKHSLSLYEVLGFIADFIENERKTKRKLKC